MQQSNRS